ncbi:Exonuclease SbcC [Clostridium sp. IBUN62F]|uniref:exonuclease SbcC n=2 Tax=Clostridium TaxID=1485 RepID=UPI00062010D0|nr:MULTISPECIES: exonuclease SbcC [unclassified Clostridium]KJZ83857.1 Exonuclease SbcC [Clostridium sp. IBUN125C]KJZ93336.1 Exonuclease SbcC [Clostridium sp. IBUN62F]
MNPYKKKVLEARKKILQLTIEQEKQINNIYAKSATRLIDEILELPDISRTRVHDIDIARLLNDYTKDLYKQLYPNIKDNTMESSIIQRQVILDYVDQVVKDRKLSEIVKHNINNYSNTVVKNLVAGEYYKDGKTLSKRLWNLTSDNSNKIDEFIKMNIAGGANARKLANDLEVLINPKNRLTTTNFKAGFDSYKVSYQAQRLARTSITHAAAETQIQTAKKNPFNRGMKWNLSPSHGARMHGKQDECDDYAGNDSYGLGAGIFPADKTPIQHPNCMCYLTEWLVEIDDAISRINKWVEGNEDRELESWSTDFNKGEDNIKNKTSSSVKVNGKDGTIDINIPKSKNKNINTNVGKDDIINNKKSFKEATNIKEAERYSINSLEFNKVSFSGIDLSVVNRINKTLTKTYDEYPMLKGFIQEIKTCKSGAPASAQISYKNGNLNTVLKLSRDDLNNLNDIDDMIKRCVEAKWWTPKDSIDGIVKHELGHMIEYASTLKMYGVDFDSNNSNLIRKVFNAISNGELSAEIKQEALMNLDIKDTKKTIVDNLSEYGTKNTKEFLAEAISEKEPRKLAQEVVKILKKKIGGIFND